jgi:hypothetical protein
MRFLRTLSVGDRFRPAHPRQVSLNGRRMDRAATYEVTKVYPMAPYTVIAARHKPPSPGALAKFESEFYSLSPGTPVLLPKELDPTEDEVMQFVGAKRRRRVVAYRVLWDGKTDLSGVVPPQAVAAMKLMHAFGKSEYGVHELHEIFNKHYEKFWGRSVKREAVVILLFYRRHMVNQGLLEEIVDVAPVPGSVIEANLQEAWRERE